MKPVENEIVVELDNDGKFRIAGSSTSAGIVFDGEGNGEFSGKLEALEIEASTLVVDSLFANKLKIGEVEGLDFVTNKLAQLDMEVATIGASLAQSNSKIDAQDKLMQRLTAQLESASGSATVTQNSNIYYGLDSKTSSISGNLRVRGNGIFEGILNVVDTLTSNNFIVNTLSTFFGDAVFKAKVAFEGQVTFSNDSGGNALIKKDAKQVEVVFENEFEDNPIVNVSVSFEEEKDEDGKLVPTDILEQDYFAQNYNFIIVNKSKKGFTIVLNKNAKEDISFTWSALRIKDARTIQSRLLE